jgi:hypothetical protein
MMRRCNDSIVRRCLTLLAGLPLLASGAFGWGCEGHQMIALIARAHMSQAASAAVDRLLLENPIDPALSRFCKDRPEYAIADAATWADDARTGEKTGDWHFIDIPLAVTESAAAGDWMRWCPPAADGKPGCIVSAIDFEWQLLRDTTQPDAARAKALRYLIHFVGDLTQPLHASDNHDRGGNCTAIRFFSQEKPENLHAIWDYKILARDIAKRKATQARYAKDLDRTFAARWSAWGESRPDVPAWTWESHKLAQTITYPDLKPLIPIAASAAGLADTPACDAGREAVAALGISIGREYSRNALPAIREQIAKAGYRLAGLLNQTFTPVYATAPSLP